MGGYCQFRAQTEAAESADSTNSFQSMVWSLIQTHFVPQNERTIRILQLFGLEPLNIGAEVESFLGHPGGSQLQNPPHPTAADPLRRGMSDQTGGDFSSVSFGGDGRFGSGFNATESAYDTENFFSRLAHTVKDESKNTDVNDPFASGDGGATGRTPRDQNGHRLNGQTGENIGNGQVSYSGRKRTAKYTKVVHSVLSCSSQLDILFRRLRTAGKLLQ